MASFFHVYFYKKYKKKESQYKGIPAYEKEKDFEKSLNWLCSNTNIHCKCDDSVMES